MSTYFTKFRFVQIILYYFIILIIVKRAGRNIANLLKNIAFNDCNKSACTLSTSKRPSINDVTRFGPIFDPPP